MDFFFFSFYLHKSSGKRRSARWDVQENTQSEITVSSASGNNPAPFFLQTDFPALIVSSPMTHCCVSRQVGGADLDPEDAEEEEKTSERSQVSRFGGLSKPANYTTSHVKGRRALRGLFQCKIRVR